MGSILCKKRNSPKIADRVHVIYEIEKEKNYEYLEPKGKMYIRRDLYWNVLLLDIKVEGCLLNQEHIWLDRRIARKWNIFLR